MPGEYLQPDEVDAEFCPRNPEDEMHCLHWYDLNPCHFCGADEFLWEPGMPITQWGGKLDCAIFDSYDLNVILLDLHEVYAQDEVR